MIIKVLVEDSTVNSEYGSEHGLSLFIQTKQHNIVFDTGQSGLFIENAEKMNADIESVDFAIISHGHYDHGGGLKDFLKINSKAKVYIHPKALCNYYALRPTGEIKYIGLEKFNDNQRLTFTDDYMRIDDELEIFSAVDRKEFNPYHNKVLYMEKESKLILDTFEHEQNLIINTEAKTLLVAGCAHSGIINILNRYREIKNDYPDFVIGGFHLFNPSSGENQDRETIEGLAHKLNNSKTMYYTGHCTGVYAYSIMKEILKEKINNIFTGKLITI